METEWENLPPLVLVLDRLRSAYNTGNIFRIAEALGAGVVCCGYTPFPPHPKLAKTAMGTDAVVPCRRAESSVAAAAELRRAGYTVWAAEPGGPEAWELEPPPRLAVVFGNEALGVAPEALAEVDGVVSLPMRGGKASINVGNAAAAILYALDARARMRTGAGA